jgi:hypothetical protein
VTAAIVPAVSVRRRQPDHDTRPAAPIPTQPLPIPPMTVPRGTDTVYGLAVMDCHGRLADRAIVRSLGWAPGRRLDLRWVDGSVLVVPDPDGITRIGGDGYLRLPVPLRRRCHLAVGDRVLLAADPTGQRLLLHPPAALDTLLAAHHTGILTGARP